MVLRVEALWPCSASVLPVLGTTTALWERDIIALSSAPDESDYQTEYEEELPDIPKETYADFQSAGTELDSDSEDEPSLWQGPLCLTSSEQSQDSCPWQPEQDDQEPKL